MENLIENISKSEININKCFEAAKTVLFNKNLTSFEGIINRNYKIAVDIFNYNIEIVEKHDDFSTCIRYPVFFNIRNKGGVIELSIDNINTARNIEGNLEIYNREIKEKYNKIKSEYRNVFNIVKSTYEDVLGVKDTNNEFFMFPNFVFYENNDEIELLTVNKLKQKSFTVNKFEHATLTQAGKNIAICIETGIDSGVDCVDTLCFIYIVTA